MIRDWLLLIQNRPSQHQIDFGRDSYDDCVADLDEQLGRLIDELDRRDILDRTWVIITADHGESFGEIPGVFWHGTSLYETQLHVPLVIIPPAGGPPARSHHRNGEPARPGGDDRRAGGFQDTFPFPGSSLTRFWTGSESGSTKAAVFDQALSEVVPLDSFGPDPSQWPNRRRWPLAALTEGDWTYIRREGDIYEQLFRRREDSHERENLASDPAMQPTLERMRRALGSLTAGPLTPERFNP